MSIWCLIELVILVKKKEKVRRLHRDSIPRGHITANFSDSSVVICSWFIYGFLKKLSSSSFIPSFPRILLEMLSYTFFICEKSVNDLRIFLSCKYNWTVTKIRDNFSPRGIKSRWRRLTFFFLFYQNNKLNQTPYWVILLTMKLPTMFNWKKQSIYIVTEHRSKCIFWKKKKKKIYPNLGIQ